MTSTGTAMTAESMGKGESTILLPDGRFLAASGASNSVVMLDALTTEPFVTYYGHQMSLYRRVSGAMKALEWLPDGSSIASSSTDGSIHIWHTRTEIHQRTLTQPQEGCAALALTLPHDAFLPWFLRGKDDNSWQLV